MTRRQFIANLSTIALLAHPFPASAKRVLIPLDPGDVPAQHRSLNVTFCAFDLAAETTAALNADDIDERHAPWSSFKIPNLIIALETSAARGLDHKRIWNPAHRPAKPYWLPTWRQDQTLRTAFQHSVPWYFQDVALEVSAEHYRSTLARFGYGNAELPDNDDDFWLGGPPKISPWEQMMFIKRLVSATFSLKAGTWQALREVSLIKTKAGEALYGKTGSGPLRAQDMDGPFEGWLVGWVERNGMPSASFALYVSGPSYPSIRTARLEIALALLTSAGHLPPNWH